MQIYMYKCRDTRYTDRNRYMDTGILGSITIIYTETLRMNRYRDTTIHEYIVIHIHLDTKIRNEG